MYSIATLILANLLIGLFTIKIRNPFKDKLLRWKDDVSLKEKLFYASPIVMLGGLSSDLLHQIGLWDFIEGILN